MQVIVAKMRQWPGVPKCAQVWPVPGLAMGMARHGQQEF